MYAMLKQGKLEGVTKKSVLTGMEFWCFLGIPYAKPPIGELRFQPPQPAEKWNGILSAKNEGSASVQENILTGQIFGSEDCLYLNVFTPTARFLGMGTKSIAGNCGLRDQCLALKSVKENLKQFGGDSEKVTLFGENAGASCVHCQMLSPVSKGLFNKAIVQSNPLYNVYKNGNRSIARRAGFEIARKLGSKWDGCRKIVGFFEETVSC